MKADLGGEDSRWLILEDGFAAALAGTRETLFTTGNGYLGTRGSLEEGHEGALPGTFLRGVFDHHDAAVPDLVKAPDWLSLAIVVNGVRLDVTSESAHLACHAARFCSRHRSNPVAVWRRSSSRHAGRTEAAATSREV